MHEERRNFAYDNGDEGICGCVSDGISEEVTDRPFDEMMGFASYAFNKGHATCYAYVFFQMVWLERYYPREFMAVLMTPVIDDGSKITKYILICR